MSIPKWPTSQCLEDGNLPALHEIRVNHFIGRSSTAWKVETQNSGRLYLVDTIAGDPEVLQADAETYYEKLLKKSLSTPDVFSIPGGGEFWQFI